MCLTNLIAYISGFVTLSGILRFFNAATSGLFMYRIDENMISH